MEAGRAGSDCLSQRTIHFRLIIMRKCSLLAAILFMAFLLEPAARAADCPGPYQPQTRIDVRWRTSWYEAIFLGCKAGQYQIKYTLDNSEELVDATRVRGLQGSSAVAAVGAKAVKPGKYGCVAFIGPVTGGGHLQHMYDLQIGSGTYVHSTGNSRGSFTYAASDSLILFQGGNMDGQAAKYDQNAQGKPGIHILNERRSRAVIDCDGPQ